jgi:L-ascorbate metabolism protein UlaG (beta-lactamase superfamily)
MPETQTLALPGTAEAPDYATGSVFFVGNATVILRYAGFTVLTDPNFLHRGDHVHLGYGLTSRRLKDPAIELDELPEIDLVVLSHLHEDHFDREVERRLNRDIPIVTTPSGARKLADKGFRATRGVPTWDTVEVVKGPARLRITATPARHGPAVAAALMPETMGSVLEFPGPAGRAAYRLYISGDTLVFHALREIPKRFPEIDLGLFHLGQTTILGLVMVTMDAAQGVEAIRIIDPDEAIPIHMDDYDVFKFSLDDFKRKVAAAGLAERVRYLDRGETYTFAVPEDRWHQA